MLPPVCEVCDDDFRDALEINDSAGGLVSFADFADLANGMVGHPDGLGWFCAKHLADAQFLSTLSKSMAISQLKKKYQQL